MVEAWGTGSTSPGVPTPSFTDDEDPPGIHLPRKVRRDVVDGYYVDIFYLLKLEGKEGYTRKEAKKE